MAVVAVSPVEPKPPAPRAVSRQFGRLSTRFGVFVTRDDDLRDLHAARDGERLFAVIDEDGFDLAAIVAVDGAGRVEHGDAVIEREARARRAPGFVSLRQGNARCRRGWPRARRAAVQIRVVGREQIEPGRPSVA